MPRFVTASEFGKIINQHRQTVINKCKAGAIPCIDVSPTDAKRVFRIDLDEALAKLRVQPQEPTDV